MNNLVNKFNEYKSIVNYRFLYILENGQSIEYKLKQTDFPHLIGLHKLKDINMIRMFNDTKYPTVNAKYIISKIKKEILTEDEISNSKYFFEIAERYINFSKDNIFTVSYTDAIINFNSSIINSTLKSDFILFENRNNGYNHLCIAMDANHNRYVESFFHNPKDLYIQNQNIVKIKKIKIYNEKGILYFEDCPL